MIEAHKIGTGHIVVARVPFEENLGGAKIRPALVEKVGATHAHVVFMTSHTAPAYRGETVLTEGEARSIGLRAATKVNFGRVVVVSLTDIAPSPIGHINDLPAVARRRLLVAQAESALLM